MIEKRRLITKTRDEESIPLSLLKKGKLHLLPLYYWLTLSYTGRELIQNQGSARFTDHVYHNKPEGKFLVGKILDGYILRNRLCRSLRHRHEMVQDLLQKLIDDYPCEREVSLLTVPCGYAMDVLNVLDERKDRRIRAYGLDLDEEAIETARTRAEGREIANISFHVGDAMTLKDYPVRSADIVSSVGFAAYLSDSQLTAFCQQIASILQEGGAFVTTCPTDYRRSSLSKDLFGLDTRHITKEHLAQLFAQSPFREVVMHDAPNGIQTVVLARK